MSEKPVGRPKTSEDQLIRAIRTAMGLSTESLADLSGVGYYGVFRAETGQVIRQESVDKIAKAINVPEDLVYYCTSQVPPHVLELIKRDPISFKELVDEWSAEPWKLTKTKEYINNLNSKKQEIAQKEKNNPEIKKLLSTLNKS